jgi:hypothetical protein
MGLINKNFICHFLLTFCIAHVIHEENGFAQLLLEVTTKFSIQVTTMKLKSYNELLQNLMNFNEQNETEVGESE